MRRVAEIFLLSDDVTATFEATTEKKNWLRQNISEIFFYEFEWKQIDGLSELFGEVCVKDVENFDVN